MSFIQREIDRLRTGLLDGVSNKEEIYAAQQALEWALEPSGIKSPADHLMGTQEDLAGCSAHPHRVPS